LIIDDLAFSRRRHLSGVAQAKADGNDSPGEPGAAAKTINYQFLCLCGKIFPLKE
jgi:hypothetical protein